MNNNYNFKQLPPFQFYVLQNFPFIEQSFDALTNYELMCKLAEKMNEVIDTTNMSGQQVQELSIAFNNLYNYVNTYFDNLDLQDEVNNKLDEMASNGILENLLNNYTNTLKVYQTLTELKSDVNNLVVGMKVKTLGYYNANDGGGAEYIISSTNDSAYSWQENLKENLYATMIMTNNTINFKQIGGKPITESETFNNESNLRVFLSWLTNLKKEIVKLYIPTGFWAFSLVEFPQLTNGFIIEGDEALNLDYGVAGTVITAYEENQTAVWSIGIDTRNSAKSFTLKNLNFSSAVYNTVTKKPTSFLKVGSALKILNSSFGILDNIGFCNIWGRGLTIASSWEMYYKLLFFRHIDAQNDDGVLVFDNMTTYNKPNLGGINASAFDNIMFEAIHGCPIKIKSQSNFGNSSFKNINFEDFRFQNPSHPVLYHSITDNIQTYRDNSEFVVHSLIEVEDGTSLLPIFINNIELNNVAFRYYTDYDTQKQYIIDTVLYIGNNFRGNFTFNNINCQGIAKDLIIMSNYPNNVIGKNVFIDFGTINVLGKPNGTRAIYELNNFPLFNYSQSKLTENFENTTVFTRANQYNNVLKAIDFVYKRVDDSNGFIQTDTDASNFTKLVVNPASAYNNENTFLNFRKTGNTLYMWAKIPAGENFRIVINDLVSQQYTEWEGTGEYKLYSLDITELNSEVVLRAITVPYDYDKSILIDYFYMI